MDVDLSAKTMNIQTSLRVAECEEFIYHDATRTHKKWSNLPTAPYTVPLAEGLLNHMMSQKDFYHAKLIASMSDRFIFQVVYNGNGQEAVASRRKEENNVNDNPDCDEDPMLNICDDMHIPLFSRTRTVSVERNRTMFCSCYNFERVGIPCSHQASVATLCYEAEEKCFLGFNHHDIAVTLVE
jgi:hypothetical protein